MILGCRGYNKFELISTQVIGSREVGYIFTFKHSAPWSGSPHVVDFEVLNNTVRSFSATPVLAPGTQEKSQTDERIFKPLKPVHFAPELRVVGDMSMNIDIILGWLGINEDLVPVLLFTNICDPLEGVLTQVNEHLQEDETRLT